MQWNLEQIRLFVSVAERQSFSAAARELKRVQSAVSNGIALLEADLGVTLFERSSGRQPRLTDEGRVLLAEAREVLGEFADESLSARAWSVGFGLARSMQAWAPDVVVSTAVGDPGMFGYVISQLLGLPWVVLLRGGLPPHQSRGLVRRSSAGLLHKGRWSAAELCRHRHGARA